jgi:hypothetical protein
VTTDPEAIPDVDITVPHQARVYNYWIGGKDHFASDRALGDAIAAMNPGVFTGARISRAFLTRAVRYLVAEAGIRQFLDIGTGIPAAGNTHEIAQGIAPESRIVYVDRDPVVLAHARALLTTSAPGACAYLDADANDPARILELAAETLDFGEPVAVVMLGILQVLREPHAVVATLMRALPSGSYLTISIPASDVDPEKQAAIAAQLTASTPGVTVRFASRADMTRYFDGLELIDPGITTVARWRPDDGTPDRDPAVYAAVGRKA